VKERRESGWERIVNIKYMKFLFTCNIHLIQECTGKTGQKRHINLLDTGDDLTEGIQCRFLKNACGFRSSKTPWKPHKSIIRTYQADDFYSLN